MNSQNFKIMYCITEIIFEYILDLFVSMPILIFQEMLFVKLAMD